MIFRSNQIHYHLDNNLDGKVGACYYLNDRSGINLMPRAKEFNPDTALREAMTVFWKRGYEATSIEDLVQAIGINRFSLYSTFGDKHRLFLKALDYYRDSVVTQLFGIVEQPDASLVQIRGYWDSLVEASASKAGPMGCLISNSATDLAPHDHEVEKKVKAHFNRLRKGFQHALANAKKRGEVSETIDLDAQARYLTVSALGLSVYTKVAPGRRALNEYKETVLAQLS